MLVGPHKQPICIMNIIFKNDHHLFLLARQDTGTSTLMQQAANKTKCQKLAEQLQDVVAVCVRPRT